MPVSRASSGTGLKAGDLAIGDVGMRAAGRPVVVSAEVEIILGCCGNLAVGIDSYDAAVQLWL